MLTYFNLGVGEGKTYFNLVESSSKTFLPVTPTFVWNSPGKQEKEFKNNLYLESISIKQITLAKNK